MSLLSLIFIIFLLSICRDCSLCFCSNSLSLVSSLLLLTTSLLRSGIKRMEPDYPSLHRMILASFESASEAANGGRPNRRITVGTVRMDGSEGMCDTFFIGHAVSTIDNCDILLRSEPDPSFPHPHQSSLDLSLIFIIPHSSFSFYFSSFISTWKFSISYKFRSKSRKRKNNSITNIVSYPYIFKTNLD